MTLTLKIYMPHDSIYRTVQIVFWEMSHNLKAIVANIRDLRLLFITITSWNLSK